MFTGGTGGVINSGGNVNESKGKLRLHTHLTSMTQNKVRQDEIVNALVLLVSEGSSG